METVKRKPYQGISNIARFNWHYYAIAFILLTALFIARRFFHYPFTLFFTVIILLILLSILVSLAVSFYIYDVSGLYTLHWLDFLPLSSATQLVNITAGFDETSSILNQKYPEAMLTVYDFYDPAQHTEISIERARRAGLIFPGTKSISTGNVPVKRQSVDYVFLFLAAHEIRNGAERIAFFKQLAEGLKSGGKIIVTEHQRDLYNFIAYNFGFFHFFSRKEWRKTFAGAGLQEQANLKITPFISTFILTNGVAP